MGIPRGRFVPSPFGMYTRRISTKKLLAPGIRAQAPGIPLDFPPLPKDLLATLQEIGQRTAAKTIKMIIVRLCEIGPLRLPELVEILKRDPDHLRKHYITSMINNHELEYLFPESPRHPQQAYKAKKLQ